MRGRTERGRLFLSIFFFLLGKWNTCWAFWEIAGKWWDTRIGTNLRSEVEEGADCTFQGPDLDFALIMRPALHRCTN